MTEPEDPVRLASARKDQAVAVLRAAFLQDATYAYVLPNVEQRTRVVNRFMDALLSFGLRYGEVYTTEEVRGVACWLRIGRPSISLWQLVRTGFALPRAVLSLQGESRKRMSDILRYNDEVHGATLQGLHWYLGALGVLPDWQRRGIGSRLLRSVLARADAEAIPCYLETQTAENVRFYRRQGFDVAHEGEVPGHGVRMWAMLRQPRQGSQARQGD